MVKSRNLSKLSENQLTSIDVKRTSCQAYKLSSQSSSCNKSDENSITICQNVNDRSLDQSVDKSDVVYQSI